MLLTSEKCAAMARALLLLLLAASPCLARTNTTEELDGDDPLDAILESALREVLASLTHPQTMLEHIKEAMHDMAPEEAELRKPELTDCDIAFGRWAVGLGKKETWAFQMIDSSSKLVTGILYGTLADLGNFDECLASGSGSPTVERPEAANGFTGRYSLLALAVQTIVKPTHGPLQVADETPEYKALATLRMSLCVPSTCPSPMVEAGIAAAFKRLNGMLARLGVHVDTHMASTSVAGPYRDTTVGDIVIMCLCAFLLLLMLIAAVVDVSLSPSAKSTRNKLSMLLAFSAWTNGKRLLTVAPPSDSNFTCINGIRFMSAAWVVLGHRYRFGLLVPFTNLITIPKRASDASTMVIAGAPLSVDTFFLIGGMVNCYAFMKSQMGRRSFNIVMYYVHRYVRLTPAFAMMVAVTATWISLVGTGPLWYEVVGEPSDNCANWWWTALLYVANYANPPDQCMMQSWYLMVDMQLHVLSPLVLIPLWKWRRVGLGWLGAVIIASCAVPFAVTYANDFRSPVSTDLSMEGQRHFMKLMYYPMHTRITSYACGTLAGYFLYLIKTGQYTRKITQNEVALGWLTSTALCLTVVLGAQPLFDVQNHEYNVWQSSFYMGFYRLAWSAGICWVVFACILGHGGPVNALLSWTPFTVLGRLTYGIYLTHAAVQMVDQGGMRTPEYYTDFKMVEKMFSDLVLASFFGLLLTLSLESPIMAIEKSLRAPRRPRPAPGPAGSNGAGVPAGVINSGFVTDEGMLKQTLDGDKDKQHPAVAADAATVEEALSPPDDAPTAPKDTVSAV